MKKLIQTLCALSFTAIGCGTSAVQSPESSVSAAPVFTASDPGLFEDPYAVTALKYYQRNFQGLLDLTKGLDLNKKRVYAPVKVSPDTPTLASTLHNAWNERRKTACDDLINQISQEVRKQAAGATLTDVQCFINPKTIHAAKFTPVIQSGGSTTGREKHYLDLRLLNRSNYLRFTISGSMGPRFLIDFNLDTSIRMELSRGAPGEFGKPIQVLKATTSTWGLKVSSGNVAAHFAQFIAQLNNKIADGINRRSQDLTGMISNSFSAGFPVGEEGKNAFYRSELNDNKFKDGYLPFLILPNRLNQAPIAVKVEPYHQTMYVSWTTPDSRPADIEKISVIRSNDKLKYSWGPKETGVYITSLPNQTNSFEVCTVNEWAEQYCSPILSAEPYGAAVLPEITMQESANSVSFSWPEWTDPNAYGELTLLREPESTQHFRLFDAGSFVAENFMEGGKHSYQFCVESQNYQKTCKTFEFVRPGAVQTGLRRPLFFAGPGNYCAGVAESNKANGTPLVIWTCIPGLLNQNFAFYSDNSLRDWNSNKCLTVVGGGPTREIVIQECTGAREQQWEKSQDGSSVVRNIGTNLCMYASGTSLNYPENKVWAKPCLESKGWLWYFLAPIF